MVTLRLKLAAHLQHNMNIPCNTIMIFIQIFVHEVIKKTDYYYYCILFIVYKDENIVHKVQEESKKKT